MVRILRKLHKDVADKFYRNFKITKRAYFKSDCKKQYRRLEYSKNREIINSGFHLKVYLQIYIKMAAP
jgi:hypothetical protein